MSYDVIICRFFFFFNAMLPPELCSLEPALILFPVTTIKTQAHRPSANEGLSSEQSWLTRVGTKAETFLPVPGDVCLSSLFWTPQGMDGWESPQAANSHALSALLESPWFLHPPDYSAFNSVCVTAKHVLPLPHTAFTNTFPSLVFKNATANSIQAFSEALLQ